MDLWITGITAPVALSAVALLGYMMGRARRGSTAELADLAQKSRDVHIMANELERISTNLRHNLAAHHSKVNRYRMKIQSLSERHDGPHDRTARSELHDMLKPTDDLTHDIAIAYEELRRHSESLNRLAV